jgi:hypothetical protein
MDTSDHKLADTARAERDGFCVLDDLASMPVSDAELDVVEAFLMAAFHAVMEGESSPQAMDFSDCDWERPQTRAEIKHANRVRRRVR